MGQAFKVVQKAFLIPHLGDVQSKISRRIDSNFVFLFYFLCLQGVIFNRSKTTVLVYSVLIFSLYSCNCLLCSLYFPNIFYFLILVLDLALHLAHMSVTASTTPGAVDFGHTTLAAGAIDAAKALVADGRPMKEWVSTLLAHTTRTPSRTITASPFACHKNAAEGFLYLLDGGLLFLTRPLWLPIDDIARIVLCAKGDSVQ